MATEHPRQHVWSGDSGDPLTFLISLYTDDNRDADVYWYLVKSTAAIAAIALAISEIRPISNDWPTLNVFCRPLYDYEVDKVSLKNGETVLLDEGSREHLTKIPTPNGEDHDNGEG